MGWTALMFLVGGVAAVPSHAEEPLRAALSDDPHLSLLKRSLDLLTHQKQFSFTAESGYDSVQEDGQKIEFGARRRIIIQRPNRIRMESHERNGHQLQVIYNGKKVSFFSPRENKYATKSKTGTLDDFLNHLVNDLKVQIPLAQVGYNNFNEIAMKDFDTGFKVEESVVAEILCDHLVFQNDQIDFQIWIRKSGDPLPVRWIITYKNEEGQPQFWVQFIEWNLNPRIKNSTFTFTPPKGAERIQFAPLESASSQEMEPLRQEEQP
jgi:hypothetical protein